MDIIGVYLGILVLGGVSGSFLSYKFIWVWFVVFVWGLWYSYGSLWYYLCKLFLLIGFVCLLVGVVFFLKILIGFFELGIG